MPFPIPIRFDRARRILAELQSTHALHASALQATHLGLSTLAADDYRLLGTAARASPSLATFTTPLLAAARLFTQSQSSGATSMSLSTSSSQPPSRATTTLKSLTQRQWKRVFETHPRLVAQMLTALGLAVCTLTEPTKENLQQRIWSKHVSSDPVGAEPTGDNETEEKRVGDRKRAGAKAGERVGAKAGASGVTVVGVDQVDVVVGRCLALVRQALAAWTTQHGRWTHGDTHRRLHPVMHALMHSLIH